MDGPYLVMDKRNGLKSVVKTLFCFALVSPQNIFSVLKSTITVDILLLFNRNKLLQSDTTDTTIPK